MCLMCVLINKEQMRPKEIARALTEFDVNDPHNEEIATLLESKGLLDETINEFMELSDSSDDIA